MWDIDEPVAWPDASRPVFAAGPPGDFNACVGWVRDGDLTMHGYMEGYARSACLVFDGLRSGLNSPEYLVFPLAFLWRQHIELSLKNVIALGRQLAGDPSGHPKGHKLPELWLEARKHICAGAAEEPEECVHVDAAISELHQVDPGSDGFRYPTAVDGVTPSLLKSPDLVNLSVLHESMRAVANFLSCVDTEFKQRLEYRAEMDAEMARTYSGS